MRRSRDGTVQAAAAVVLLVATTHHLATAFSPASSSYQRTSTYHSSEDIPRVRQFGSDSRHAIGRMAARLPRSDHLALNIKSPWRTAVDAEEKTAATASANGGKNSSPSDGLFRFFDGTSNDNNNGNQITKNQIDGDNNNNKKKGPLGFLKRDVSPLAVDDEWAFSLKSVESSAPSSSSRMQMSDESDNDSTGEDVAMMAGVGIVIATAVAAATALGFGVVDDFSLPGPNEAIASVEHLFADPTSTLEGVVQNVEEMGPSGLFYFGLVYTVAEILAIPAIPLTASAGYLFGTVQGTSVVLVSASIAAAVSFIIGRTLLRSYVEEVLEEYPKFAKIDKAIGREGFKLMVLLRLSPIFPFALSNYLYGATSVQFWPFFLGTLVGFTPGTIAYVSTGSIGKALTLDSASAYPWYAYAGGFALLTIFLKVSADVATGIIEELDEEV